MENVSGLFTPKRRRIGRDSQEFGKGTKPPKIKKHHHHNHSKVRCTDHQVQNIGKGVHVFNPVGISDSQLLEDVLRFLKAFDVAVRKEQKVSRQANDKFCTWYCTY